jgi:hypothetical protein
MVLNCRRSTVRSRENFALGLKDGFGREAPVDLESRRAIQTRRRLREIVSYL